MDVRPARHEDYDAVAAFTADTWADRGGSDYIPDIYHEWIEDDGERQQTFVLDMADEAERPSADLGGICQVVQLSEYEAWAQGMRVNPEYRGQGLSLDLSNATFAWARERGTTVVRNMVFSWNRAGLGVSRAAGFDPGVEFRWARPEPDPTAEPKMATTDDVDAAWSFWTQSDARTELQGLALDTEESWAVSELTRADLREAADDDRLVVVQEHGTRAFAFRNRVYEREDEDGTPVTWAEYGVGAWRDVDGARALFRAVSRDAAETDADRTRVLFPEGVRWVSDAAAAGVDFREQPTFVMSADLTDERVGAAPEDAT